MERRRAIEMQRNVAVRSRQKQSERTYPFRSALSSFNFEEQGTSILELTNWVPVLLPPTVRWQSKNCRQKRKLGSSYSFWDRMAACEPFDVTLKTSYCVQNRSNVGRVWKYIIEVAYCLYLLHAALRGCRMP